MYYAIVKFSLEGNEILDGYDSYEDAEGVIDSYADAYHDRYPEGFVSIVQINN